MRRVIGICRTQHGRDEPRRKLQAAGSCSLLNEGFAGLGQEQRGEGTAAATAARREPFQPRFVKPKEARGQQICWGFESPYNNYPRAGLRSPSPLMKCRCPRLARGSLGLGAAAWPSTPVLQGGGTACPRVWDAADPLLCGSAFLSAQGHPLCPSAGEAVWPL